MTVCQNTRCRSSYRKNVPYKVAEAITKKVEPTVVSMGSGPGVMQNLV